MKIILIRHGETTQNTHENFDNIPDCYVPLTELGKKQATECGEFLKEYCKNNNINALNTVIVISPFTRTRQTLNELNNVLKFDNIQEDALIIERQFGLFDNLTREEHERYPISNNFDNWMREHNANFYSKYPLGESNYDVFVRARMFLITLKELQKKYENVILISHGGFLKCFEMAYFNYSPEWFLSTPYMDNCSIKLIEDDNNKNYIYKGPII